MTIEQIKEKIQNQFEDNANLILSVFLKVLRSDKLIGDDYLYAKKLSDAGLLNMLRTCNYKSDAFRGFIYYYSIPDNLEITNVK